MRPLVAAFIAVAGLALAGCGIKGPLYLPEKSSEVIVRPAPTATPPAEQAPPPGEKPVEPPADATGPPRD